MKKPFLLRLSLSLGLASLCLLNACTSSSPQASAKRLSRDLTFHAGFDGTTDATYGLGERRLQVGKQWGKPRDVVPGLPPGNTVHLAPGVGRYGGALQFEKRIPELVCYQAAGNFPYSSNHWSGTVSFWLKLDPETDLEPGYCDTIQITSKDWNDAAFFTEFTKDEKPREFRFGAYADLPVWNPTGRKWEDIPLGEKPLVPMVRPPFRKDRWIHVAFTWDRFNTGQPNGVADLYVDGQRVGQMPPRNQQFTWDLAQTRIMLGLSYTGFLDDLAIFRRALTAGEVAALRDLPSGVRGLYR